MSQADHQIPFDTHPFSNQEVGEKAQLVNGY
jgi:hypothetical protein